MKKKNFIRVLFITFLGLIQLVFAQNSSYDEITKSFKVTSGGNLTVNVEPGEIVITVWDKNEVLVKVANLEKKELDNVTMEQKGNTVDIKYVSKWGWSDDAKFFINVPKRFNLKLETSGGDIQIKDDLEGNVNVSTKGGEIKLSNIKGDVNANTMGGDIRTGNIEGICKLNTMGGDIRTGDLIKGVVDVNTYGGDINIKSTDASIKANTYGGDIRIGNIGGEANISTYGGDIKLNSVSGNSKINTFGGDISLSNGRGRINATTKGGDITLKNISGSVIAKTSAGNISVELVSISRGISDISTSAGEITLNIGTNVKASIEAEIKGYTSKNKKLKIISDFKADKYTENEKTNKITATYNLNGGGEKILLKTINSNIIIKKIK